MQASKNSDSEHANTSDHPEAPSDSKPDDLKNSSLQPVDINSETKNSNLAQIDDRLVHETRRLGWATALVALATLFLGLVTSYQVWSARKTQKQFAAALSHFETALKNIGTVLKQTSEISQNIAALAGSAKETVKLGRQNSRREPLLESIDDVCQITAVDSSHSIYRLDSAENCSHISLTLKNPASVAVTASVALQFNDWACPATASRQIPQMGRQDFSVNLDMCLRRKGILRQGSLVFTVKPQLLSEQAAEGG